jgi:predicted dehydrogenase
MKTSPRLQPVTVGLIGCGNISAAYLRAAPQFPELQLVACADLDIARARVRAREFGLRAVSVEALLADKSIEVVLNLTVPQAHVPVGLAAIAHGKHVYGEKPLAASTKEARRLLTAAAKKRLRVGSAPDTFLGGAHQTARRLIDEGAIGKPLSGTAFMMNHGHEHWHPDPAFYYAAGGGPMFDMGPYYLTNLVNLLGPVARVSGVATAGFAERKVLSEPRKGEAIKVKTATHVAGLLTFVSGAVISITTSFDVWAHRHSNMEIYGSEGSLAVPDPNRFGGTVSLARGRDPWTDVPLSHGFADGNFRIVGLADFARAIRTGRPHRCSGEMAFHVLEVMEAFQSSSKTGRAVTIDSRCQRPAALPRHPLLGELN